MLTVKLKLNGLHCTSCIMNIEGELEDTNGVKRVSASFAKSEADVEYDESIISPERIIEIIKKLGYEAEVV